MQRKSVVDFTTTRTSRIDRFAQMSKVEQVIEQKKREIQARLQKSGQSEIITESHSSPNNNSQTAVNQQPVKTSRYIFIFTKNLIVLKIKSNCYVLFLVLVNRRNL